MVFHGADGLPALQPTAVKETQTADLQAHAV